MLGWALAVAGCSGGDDSKDGGAQVSCDWFVQDNCWKTAVAEANACVDGTLTGNVSSDTRTCSYADGTSIAFSNPLSGVANDNYVWDFSVTRQGQNCVTFKELGATGDDGFLLRTASGEVREESVGLDVVFSCPSGERVRVDFMTAFSCLDKLPGIAWSSSASNGVSASLSLLGGASNDQLFSCSSP